MTNKHQQGGGHEERILKHRLEELAILSSDLERLNAELETINSRLRSFSIRAQGITAPLRKQIDLVRAEFIEAVLSRSATGNQPFDPNAAANESTQEADRSKRRSSVSLPLRTSENGAEPGPRERVRSLYRKLVKLAHPDLTTSKASRDVRTRFMQLVNQAYEDGDGEGLARLLEQWDSYPESVEGTGPAAELLRVEKGINLVRQRVRDVASEIAMVKASEAYALLREATARGSEAYLARLVSSLEAELAELELSLADVRNRPLSFPLTRHQPAQPRSTGPGWAVT